MPTEVHAATTRAYAEAIQRAGIENGSIRIRSFYDGILRMAPEQKWNPYYLGNLAYAGALMVLFQWGVMLHDLEAERRPVRRVGAVAHTGFDALGQIDLVLRGQQSGAADAVQVHAHQIRGGTLCVEIGLGQRGPHPISGAGCGASGVDAVCHVAASCSPVHLVQRTTGAQSSRARIP